MRLNGPAKKLQRGKARPYRAGARQSSTPHYNETHKEFVKICGLQHKNRPLAALPPGATERTVLS